MTIVYILTMLFGFGFVIFWHELGHFIGARRAGIRVEQFAVGMGQAIVSYRKGLGVRLMGFGKGGWHWGDTLGEYDARTAQVLNDRGELPRGDEGKFTAFQRGEAAKSIGISETEYRLAWLPIGGYVKPTGQDDLRPSAVAAADDPYCYAAAPVGKRMVLISAGVVMNVILAGMLFFVLFYVVGFKSMRATVGLVQSDSPAAFVGLRGGDELLELNGHTLHDFTKILMNVALLPSDEAVPLKIRRDGREQTLQIQARATSDHNNMLALGIGPASLLSAMPADKFAYDKVPDDVDADAVLLEAGERISAVEGKPVAVDDYATFDRAIQTSFGRPVKLTIVAGDGTSRDASFVPPFSPMFDKRALDLAGLAPQTRIAHVQKESPAAGKLRVGDVVLSVRRKSDGSVARTPTPDEFVRTVTGAGAAGDTVTIDVDRDGQRVTIDDLSPNLKLATGKRGLGVAPDADVDYATIGAVARDSAAGRAGIPAGAAIKSIAGQPIATWYDVHRALARANAKDAVEVVVSSERGDETFAMTLDPAEVTRVAGLRYANPIVTLAEMPTERKTSNPLTAVGWGISETRDLILQGYLTLQRVFGGSVPASSMSGPVGIFKAGTSFAQRGPDWFIWFLAVISANLAVVNFLPVPILDGWHFLGLVKEKLTGRPMSEGVQVVAQYVGLALILSLLVFVTFNDLTR